MKPAGKMEGDNEALRERLTRLNQASLRINECLDFNTVLQGVLDSARSLTGACYGVMTFLDDSGFSASSFLRGGQRAVAHRKRRKWPESVGFTKRGRIDG